jgi:hypothetical protein
VGVTESARATTLARSFFVVCIMTLNTDFSDFFFQMIEGTGKEEKGEKINFRFITLAVLKICRIFVFFFGRGSMAAADNFYTTWKHLSIFLEFGYYIPHCTFRFI